MSEEYEKDTSYGATCPSCRKMFAADDIGNCDEYYRTPCCNTKVGKLLR